MKLYFIYGPPASGKLSIAEKLSEATGLALFHNHLSRDIVKDIYKDKLDDNLELINNIRVDVFEYCAKRNDDLIFTFVYGGQRDDKIVKKYIKTIEDHEGRVIFIQIKADNIHLLTRVGNVSRKRYKKLTDEKVLSKLLEEIEFSRIPYVDSFVIDTSQVTPEEAVASIIKGFRILD
jgi:hypothetical protein